MGTISGMLALALLGAEPTTPPTPGQPIACQARVMTVDGLDWRRAGNVQLTAIKRTPTTAVWVADRSVQAALVKRAGARVSAPLALGSPPETAAAASWSRAIEYVQAHQWKHAALGADIEWASEIRTQQGTVEEKFEVRTSAKRLDQGTLAQVWLADSHVARMHKAPVAPEGGVELDFNIRSADDPIRSADDPGVEQSVEAIGDTIDAAAEALVPTYRLLKLFGAAFDAADAATHDPIHLGTVEVPEIVAATAEGEWLIPHDSVLIVSLGVHTGADAQGKAIARERLAILDFGAKPGPAPVAAARPVDDLVRACEASGPPPAPIAVSSLNMPAVPARSLPEAIDKDGQVVDLPPLPEAYAAADLNQVGPGSPRATPQSPLARAARPKAMVDPQLARTSFEAPTAAPAPEEVIGVRFRWHEGGERELRSSMEVVKSAAPRPTQLAQLVEGFLRRGMEAGQGAGCPAEACPADEAKDCDEAGDCPECPAGHGCPAAGAPASDAATANPDLPTVRETFSAAFQNPGTTETRLIPLGKGLALEVRVRIVPQPPEAEEGDDQARSGETRGAGRLVADVEQIRPAGDGPRRTGSVDQSSRATPFKLRRSTSP